MKYEIIPSGFLANFVWLLYWFFGFMGVLIIADYFSYRWFGLGLGLFFFVFMVVMGRLLAVVFEPIG